MQKRKIAVYIATSIDGYIAKANGDISWLDLATYKNEDYGFKNFIEKIDTVILGRKTYEESVKAYKTADWPYTQKKLIVLSNTLKSVIDEATLCSQSIKELMKRISSEKRVKNVWVDGGQVISQFLDLNLIDEITISVIPIILGEGIPLFSTTKNIFCDLVNSKSFPSGVVQLKYEVKHS